MVDVEAYSDRWPKQFERVRHYLRAGLSRIPRAKIEHVGSTSVPGLASKPVIDIDVIVSAAELHEAIDALEALGYRHLGERGVPGRHAFDAPDDEPTRNVYVGLIDSIAIRNHIALRDALRGSESARRRYGRVKRMLAQDPTRTIDSYVSGKSGVIREILAETGAFTDAELDTIASINSSPPDLHG